MDELMSAILVMLSPDQISVSQLEEIQAISPGRKLLVSLDRPEIESHTGEIEIAVGWVPHDLVAKCENLRWFQQWGAGADWLLSRPELVEKKFTLTNASGIHAIPISEHIFALLLAFARRLPTAIKAQEKHNWLEQSSHELFELAGKTMVLLGVGAIGERTAMIANAMGMRVLGVRKNPMLPASGVEKMFDPSQLMEILPQADFLVLTIPLTSDTRGIIGEPELKALKPTAYVINIGRGGTIQQTCLQQALQQSWIAGAGLDVFETEPLPPDSPLWEMENVILTSHYAGLTPKYTQRGMDIFIDNLRRYQAGNPLHNVVDKELGY
jgi:D-2-hydroxyacid dehydrogenase (NADP+)